MDNQNNEVIEETETEKEEKVEASIKEDSKEKEDLKKNENKNIIIIIVAVIAAISIGFCVWYFGFKKPYDTAVEKFNTAAEKVKESNTELDSVIEKLNAVLELEEQPYEESKLNDAQTALQTAQDAEVIIPDVPDNKSDVEAATAILEEPIDYKKVIDNLNEKKTALETSIAQQKQITNPEESFV